MLVARIAGWALMVRSSSSAGPSTMRRAIEMPSAASARSMIALRLGRALEQGGAHAHVLRALAGKHEGMVARGVSGGLVGQLVGHVARAVKTAARV